MNPLAWLHPDTVLVEVEPRALTVLHRGRTHSWSLERTPAGSLTDPCATRLRKELPAALERHPWQPRLPARCALPASGVTLRRWQIPPTSPDELEGVLRLRLESELPLPPDQLAWGWLPLHPGPPAEILVAALRRDSARELAELLGASGLDPSFTLAALARLTPDPAREPSLPPGGALLTIGTHQSEWLQTDAHGPVRLRVLPWGEEMVLREMAARSGTASAGDPSTAGLGTLPPEGTDGPASPALASALERALDALAAHLPKTETLSVEGRLAASPAFREALGRRLAPATRCQFPASPESPGSSALLGLERQVRERRPGLTFRTEEPVSETRALLAQRTPRRWIAFAAVLLVVLLALPYAEAFLLGPGLAARVKAIKDRQDRLGLIDREADFLRTLRTEQAPALEVLQVLARTAPPGARIESLVLNRKGELSLRLALRQPPEVTDFRSKLADCGFFSSVVVEEQAPSPDRQKISVRLSALVKPPAARGNLPILAPEPPPPTNTAPTGSAGPVAPPGAAPPKAPPGPVPHR